MFYEGDVPRHRLCIEVKDFFKKIHEDTHFDFEDDVDAKHKFPHMPCHNASNILYDNSPTVYIIYTSYQVAQHLHKKLLCLGVRSERHAQKN